MLNNKHKKKKKKKKKKKGVPVVFISILFKVIGLILEFPNKVSFHSYFQI